MAGINKADIHQLKQVIMVWFTKRRKRQVDTTNTVIDHLLVML